MGIEKTPEAIFDSSSDMLRHYGLDPTRPSGLLSDTLDDRWGIVLARSQEPRAPLSELLGLDGSIELDQSETT